MKCFVATKNLGKLDELKAIFQGSPLELDTYPLYQDVAEGDESYAQNAALKARALFKQLQDGGIRASVLADDSGLEVYALDGRPGVLSARYAGKDATWPQRREKLLGELRDVPDANRDAKFCCAVVLIDESGREIPGYGEVEGSITHEERGRFGFGYDPIFYYRPLDRSFAELSDEEKNAVSHRRRAADALLENLNVG